MFFFHTRTTVYGVRWTLGKALCHINIDQPAFQTGLDDGTGYFLEFPEENVLVKMISKPDFLKKKIGK